MGYYRGEVVTLAKGSGGEMVTSPPLKGKVEWSRPTMIRAHCLRVRQNFQAQKNNQKNASSSIAEAQQIWDELNSSFVRPFPCGKITL